MIFVMMLADEIRLDTLEQTGFVFHFGKLMQLRNDDGIVKPASDADDRQPHDKTAEEPVSYTHLTLPTICSV